MNQYGVLIDRTMVRNALQTDGAEVRDLLTVKMALTEMLLLGVLPCWLWNCRWNTAPAGGGWSALGAPGHRHPGAGGDCRGGLSGLCLAVSQTPRTAHGAGPAELPASVHFLPAQSHRQTAVLQQIGLDAKQTAAAHDKPRVLVLVVGGNRPC